MSSAQSFSFPMIACTADTARFVASIVRSSRGNAAPSADLLYFSA
jgi:hypothetical protein